MTIINEWLPSSLINSDKVFLMRSQYSDRGPKITEMGMQSTQPELSSRRKSVILIENGDIYFIIGAVVHSEPYNNEDILEPLRCFESGQFQVLKKWLINEPIDVAITWSSFPQDVEKYFNATLIED